MKGHIETLYKCSRCSKLLPKDQFTTRNDRSRGCDYICKVCRRDVQRQYKQRFRDSHGYCRNTKYNHEYQKCKPLGEDKYIKSYRGVCIAEEKFHNNIDSLNILHVWIIPREVIGIKQSKCININKVNMYMEYELC